MDRLQLDLAGALAIDHIAVAVAEAAVKSAAVEQAPAAVKEEKPASKTTRKASAKKAPAAKKTDAPKVSLTLQYLGKELTQEAMVEAVKAQWTGADIKTLALYVKPEDNADSLLGLGSLFENRH